MQLYYPFFFYQVKSTMVCNLSRKMGQHHPVDVDESGTVTFLLNLFKRQELDFVSTD